MELSALSWADLETGQGRALSGFSPSAPESDQPPAVSWVHFSPLSLPLEVNLPQKPSPPLQESVEMRVGFGGQATWA